MVGVWFDNKSNFSYNAYIETLKWKINIFS
jgi:hypothetical protein